MNYFTEEIIEQRLMMERTESHMTMEEVDKRRQELISEMAYVRNDFQQYVRYHFRHIISHLALIAYARLHNQGNSYIPHWKDELSICCSDVQNMDTKPKKGNRDMVYKALTEEWETKSELKTDIRKLESKYAQKFKEEGITATETDKTCINSYVADTIPYILHDMAYGNESTTEELLNRI